MRIAGGGFEQRYNPRAVVAEDSLPLGAADVVQAATDKQPPQPIWRFGTFTCRERNAGMLNKVVALPQARCRRPAHPDWRSIQGFATGNVAPLISQKPESDRKPGRLDGASSRRAAARLRSAPMAPRSWATSPSPLTRRAAEFRTENLDAERGTIRGRGLFGWADRGTAICGLRMPPLNIGV